MEQPSPEILARLKGPAIALIVTSVIGILLNLASPLMGAAASEAIMEWFQTMLESDPNFNQEQFDRTMEEMEAATSFGLMDAMFMVFGLAMSGLVLFGSLQMMKAKSWALALIASILAMIPCVSPCCVLGLPFGIWALVVLVKPEVKEAFT